MAANDVAALAARIHGARFLGGCCGTGDEMLTAMAGALGFLDGGGAARARTARG